MSGKIYNIGSGVGTSLVGVANKIIKQSGKGKIVYVPWSRPEQLVETGDYISNISKVVRDTGWKPKTSISDGIKLSFQFMQSI